MRFSFKDAAVRGIACGILVGVLNYPFGLGHGEVVVDAAVGSAVLTIVFLRSRPDAFSTTASSAIATGKSVKAAGTP